MLERIAMVQSVQKHSVANAAINVHGKISRSNGQTRSIF